MTKKSGAVLTADDLFAGLVGTEVEHEMAGVGTVKLRSLTTAEIAECRRRAKRNEFSMTVWIFILGMVEPKIPHTDFDKLMGLKPGPINDAAKRIMELSGMVNENDANEDGETFGTFSSDGS